MIGAGIKEDIKQNHNIDKLEQENDKQQAQIDTGIAVDKAQNAAIEHNYDIDKGQQHEINDLKDGLKENNIHDAMQDGAIIGGMIKDEQQDDRLDAVEDKNDRQDAAIEMGIHKDEAQDAAIAGGIAHDAMQDGAIIGGMLKDEQQDDRLDAVEDKNTQQDKDILGGKVHDAIQDGAIIGGMIKDEQQDGRLEAVEDKNAQQDKDILGGKVHDAIQDGAIIGGMIKDGEQDSRLDVVEEVNKDQQSQIDDVRGEIGTEHAERVEADQNLQNNIDAVDDKVGNLNYSSHDYVDVGDDTTTAIGKLDDALGDVEYKAQQHTSVTISDSNIHLTASTNANGGTNYDISLSKNPNFNSVTAGGVTINKDGSGTIGGLQNTTWNGEHYTHGQAATEDQLHQAIQTNVGDLNYGDHLNYVTNGESTTTSIGKLDDNLGRVENQVNANTSAISGLNSRVDTLDGRIDKVGANAAALAALHPMDFDPDDKWDFAAGVGNYGGENAMAVGAFYRPNEDTMVSVGGSFGTGENMVNAGVSFKIGQGNHVSTSRVAMAKEIETLRHNVAQLTELVNALVGEKQQVQTAETTPFPDVPENHWAYETVKKMADRGLIEGYPDGTFGGDRQMTRYEFATIVYRALQQGLGMNEDIQRLAEEFKPELALIRVDTVATDSEGNPTIERVRVNKA